MKRVLVLILTVVMVMSCVAGCGKKGNIQEPQAGQTEETDNSISDESGVDGDTQKSELSVDELKDIYKDFLRGTIRMKANTGMYSNVVEGQEYSYEDLVALGCGEASREPSEGDIGYEAYLQQADYAFIDCGDDGVPELALRLVIRGDIDIIQQYYIFKYIDEQVMCVAATEGFYRSYAEINEYGYIENGGSYAFDRHDANYSYVNAKGEEVFLYSYSQCVMLSEPYVDYYSIPESVRPDDYPMDMYISDDTFEYVTREGYNFEEFDAERYNSETDYGDKYELSRIYTFTDMDGNMVNPEPYMKEVFDKAGIKYYKPEEAMKLVAEHEEALGVTEKIRTGGEPDWQSVLEFGGTLGVKPSDPSFIMTVLAGKWKMADGTLTDDIKDLYIDIDKTGEYKMDINFADNYTAPGLIRGHLTFTSESGYTYDANQIGFFVDSSNVDNIPPFRFMGTYGIESCKYNKDEITLRFYGLGESFLEKCSKETYPTFVRASNGYIEDNGIYLMTNNPSEEYYFIDGYDGVDDNVTLEQISCKDITGYPTADWLYDIGSDYQEYAEEWSDEKYIYRTGGIEGYGTKSMLYLYDKQSGELIHAYDFHDFKYAPGYDGDAYVDRGIRYAKADGDLVYVSLYHNTYAESCPQNAYIIAVDMNYGYVKWKSDPLVSNSYNFVIAKDDIITGYGFTAEDHYLTILNKHTGELLSKVPVKKSPEIFHLDGDKLYVRTYSYDYEFVVK